MQILPLSAYKDNYIWLIFNPEKNTVTCVDPGEAEPVLTLIEKHDWILQQILITHHHSDHIGGVPALLKHAPSCKIYGPKDVRIPFVNHIIEDQDVLLIEKLSFKGIKIPGHTHSHIAYYAPEEKWLFCGDTLFSGGCGRVFDGTIEELYDSLQKIKKLPQQTQIYCAHEYTENNLRFALTIEPTNKDIQNHLQQLKNATCSLPSTLELEMKINPFLRTYHPHLKAFAHARGIDPSNEFDIFKQLRLEKDAWRG